jgi:hypothetical protein
MRHLSEVEGGPVPPAIAAERGRLVTRSWIPTKYVFWETRRRLRRRRNLVVGLSALLREIGMSRSSPPQAGASGLLKKRPPGPARRSSTTTDFLDIEAAAADLKPDIMIGNARATRRPAPLCIPPWCARAFRSTTGSAGGRIQHYGYRGTQSLSTGIVKRPHRAGTGFVSGRLIPTCERSEK